MSGLPKKILDLASKWAIPASFLIALVATSGSLYFSEVAKFEPCVLCWYQRIFMYPLVLLFCVSLLRKEYKQIIYYALPLVVVGMAISGFHYAQQLSPDSFLPCKSIGYSVSCTKYFFKTFGYVTIPTMSLSAFSLIFSFLLAKRARSL
ncbi:hypothetical protein A2690_05075 [Candidatus Roizmanbacteria bacterium RIFCSPHIGHO2_01_FULL_39_12b]|uniref:2-oxoglutarate dehydrogenase n=1 Tax=Candidatus Roizmanbacteria bacterium RIFCSPHIGHO2_01_FULL_39_12b TaxID=1802030 RepID=A0A1F7G9J9_9BACT|nr:MAG: hypothetical protein A2690_05075 [Candidatus Roizmanbacteria bacterium RIFCSPHIGHO2_01_FULL_39_12b]OGK45921.1 MAG: hypothetical protein A3B46_03415 [Candidatus Roizmanbacteria bacterium RIFCSPLOWO2_01_FULL_39_19]